MLSINTNLSSLIAQNSMKQSTNKLNQAIERMTTGYKINHSKDNAANYSIATSMDTKIGAYMVAEDNVLSGLDLVSTANEVISLMEDRASRLSALSIQTRNGTYGTKSLEALNSEASALVSEIMRLYNSTQYNNVNLFNRSSFNLDENLPKAGESGFIDETALISTTAFDESLLPKAKAEYGGFIENPKTHSDVEVAAMTPLTDAVTTITSGEKYSISNVDELINLRELVNSGVDTTRAIFVLGADIDLSSIANWTPIGTDASRFQGVFDGNGHVIKNLNISGGSYRGLFGYVDTATIENIGINEGTVNGGWESIGALAGRAINTNISNCFANTLVKGSHRIGGLIGSTNNSIIDYCYTSGTVVSAERNGGGLIGEVGTSSIINSYSISYVQGKGDVYNGGLAGSVNGESDVINCYATGNVEGKAHVGGLIGYIFQCKTFSNCYASGNVEGTSYLGGIAGSSDGIITNSSATGKVSGTGNFIGGLVGEARHIITNSWASGAVSGIDQVGGLAGAAGHKVTNCYATGDVNSSGTNVGGLFGSVSWGESITNCYATGNIKGVTNVGGLIGKINGVKQENNFSTGNVFGETNVGGYAGYSSANLTNCYSTGDTNGIRFVGGFIGQAERPSYSNTYTKCHSYGSVFGTEGVGGLIGGAVLTTNGTSFGTLYTVDCQSVQQSVGPIGGVYQYDSATTTYTLLSSYDMSAMLAGIKEYVIKPTSTTLHIGINSNDSSSLSFDTNFIFDFTAMNSDVSSDEFYNSINSFVSFLQEKTTILGAVQNRLESALDEISTQYENLVSSRSTLRDADIAEVSSEYIRQQILQQASATLLSTANQSPSIALQLI